MYLTQLYRNHVYYNQAIVLHEPPNIFLLRATTKRSNSFIQLLNPPYYVGDERLPDFIIYFEDISMYYPDINWFTSTLKSSSSTATLKKL